MLPVPEGPRPLKRSREKAPATSRLYWILPIVVLCLAGADLLYFSRIEEQTPPAMAQTPAGTDATGASVSGECAYDTQKPRIPNYASLVRANDPQTGKLDAPVTVIEYFDPNCPHCIHAYPDMKKLLEMQADSARFVFKPILIFKQYSREPVIAMHEAANAGKFFEMMDLQMGSGRNNVLSMQELQSYITRVGMNPDDVLAQINSGAYNILLNQEERAFLDAGLTSVPTVIINGNIVASNSRNPECMAQLINQAYAQAQP